MPKLPRLDKLKILKETYAYHPAPATNGGVLTPQRPQTIFTTIDEAAAELGLSRATVYRHLLPVVPHRQIGGRIYIVREALLNFCSGEASVQH